MPITEPNVRIIAKLVADYLGKHTIDARIKTAFPDLLKSIRERLFGAVDDIELASIAAECILGPGAAQSTVMLGPDSAFHRGAPEVPPKYIRDEVLSILTQVIGREHCSLTMIFEVVVAYGCGNWRVPVINDHRMSDSWDAQWVGAVRMLTHMMLPAVAEANKWMEGHVFGFVPRSKELWWNDANCMVAHFLRPVEIVNLTQDAAPRFVCYGTEVVAYAGKAVYVMPAGSKLVFRVLNDVTLESPLRDPMHLPNRTRVVVAARDKEMHILPNGARAGSITLPAGHHAGIQAALGAEIWACRCGWVGCEKNHRLSAWSPRRLLDTLERFVYLAVMGPTGLMQTHSFTQGMYMTMLCSGEGFAP